MSLPRIPLKLFDDIIDLLHDDPKTLKACCLVSKSWVPRSRKYLFEVVKIKSSKRLKAWKKIFSDPATSPAHHTRSLELYPTHLIAAEDGEDGSWIKSFTKVVRLVWLKNMEAEVLEQITPFVPFPTLPSVKYLSITCINISSLEVLQLICSFPLLEDLEIASYKLGIDDIDGSTPRPSTLALLAGTLTLDRGVVHAAGLLLHLQAGLRFRKIVLNTRDAEDLAIGMAVVEQCRDTLERIQIGRPENGKLCPLGYSIFDF